MPETTFNTYVVVVVAFLAFALVVYKARQKLEQRVSDKAEIQARTNAFEEMRRAHPEWRDDLDRVENPRDPLNPN